MVRGRRKWALLAPARVAYSGSADWSARLEVAMRFSICSRVVAVASWCLVLAATRATPRTQSLGRTFSTNSFGLQE